MLDTKLSNSKNQKSTDLIRLYNVVIHKSFLRHLLTWMTSQTQENECSSLFTYDTFEYQQT